MHSDSVYKSKMGLFAYERSGITIFYIKHSICTLLAVFTRQIMRTLSQTKNNVFGVKCKKKDFGKKCGCFTFNS